MQERRFWNKYAASLAEIRERPHSWIFVPFLATTLLGPSHAFMYRHVARPDVTSILDVGCGIGWQLVQGAKLGKQRCVGVDISPDVLNYVRAVCLWDAGQEPPAIAAALGLTVEAAAHYVQMYADFSGLWDAYFPGGAPRGLAGRRGLGLADRIETLAGDFNHVPLQGPFDAVVAWDALHHFPGIERVLNRIDGLLRLGGYLILHEPVREAYSAPVNRFIEYISHRYGTHFDFARLARAAPPPPEPAGPVEATAPVEPAGPGVPEAEPDVRYESPMGDAFFERHASLDGLLRRRYRVLRVEYHHIFTPFWADYFGLLWKNARGVSLARGLLPPLYAVERLLCRIPALQGACMHANYFLQKRA